MFVTYSIFSKTIFNYSIFSFFLLLFQNLLKIRKISKNVLGCACIQIWQNFILFPFLCSSPIHASISNFLLPFHRKSCPSPATDTVYDYSALLVNRLGILAKTLSDTTIPSQFRLRPRRTTTLIIQFPKTMSL